MSGELTLAIPSKGRLEEQARAVFAQSGMTVARPGGARSYLGHLEGLEGVVVRFLPATDIARELIRGTIDVGVTGVDVVYEAAENGPDNVVFACALGFGEADVVIAVPDAWIDVAEMVDLADVASDFRARHGRWLRVATKYVNLTRHHFARAGIAEYRIVESLGATEAAPASGAADLIVDITSTGSTLSANGLRVLNDGVLLHSEAMLITSKHMEQTPTRRLVLREMLRRLGASHQDDEATEQPTPPQPGLTSPAIAANGVLSVVLEIEILLLLAAVGLVAGFVDAIAGGGGLIALPALLSVGLPPVAALATNKMQSVVGTAIATLTYWRRGFIALRALVPAIGLTFLGSALGAFVIQRADTSSLQVAVPVALIAIAGYFLFAPNLSDADRAARLKFGLFVPLMGLVIGFYDGVFGPGTGSFLTMGFVMLFGLGLTRATGHTKALNFTSNVAALALFIPAGAVVWPAALAMAGGQIIGAYLGALTGIRFGARLIRPLIIIVSVGLALRLLWQAIG